MKKRILCLILAFIIAFPGYAFAFRMDSYDMDLKIGLYSMASQTIKVTLNGDYLNNGKVYNNGTSFILQQANGKISFNQNSYDSLQFSPLGSNSTITLESGTKVYKYLGSMIFKYDTSGVLPVNLVKIDDYLKGVVAYEMSDSYPLEALKAQAVAARNYAIISIGRHRSSGYDLCDGQHCQVYRGYNSNYKNVIRAVDETKGIVLLYNDSPVSCYYSSSNGGYTEDTRNPWSAALPYLIVKKDDYDSVLWPGGDRKLTTKDIDTKLKEKGIIANSDSFVRLDISSIQRYENVRISKLNIIVKDANNVERVVEIKKEGVRTFLSFPSSYYDVKYDTVSDTYTFSGKGYGHGIGMSQIGAKNRAIAGMNYEEILKFYYSGSYVKSVASNTIYIKKDKDTLLVGDEVRLSAYVATGASNMLYKYVIKNGNTIVYTKEYSSSDEVLFRPNSPGEHTITLYVKAQNSSNEYDELRTSTLTVLKPSTPGKLNLLFNTLYVNTPITVFAAAGGESGNSTRYIFEVIKDGKVVKTGETASPTYSFTLNAAGNYTVRMKVSNSSNSADYDDLKEINLGVKPQVQSHNPILAPTRILQKGMSGSDVKALQDLLARLRYFNARSTIYFEGTAETAVKNFQKDAGLSQTGIADAATINAINNALQIGAIVSTNGSIIFAPSRTLKAGMSGNDVKVLQDLLARLKYFTGKSSTYYSSAAVTAVKRIQKAYGLSQTGIVDAATANAINRALKVKTSSSTTTAPASPANTSGTAGTSAPSSARIVFTPTRTLKKGMSGNDVKTLQDLLARLKYFNYRSTTYFGSITETAVKSFQKANGLSQTGIADANLVRKIVELVNR